MRFKVHGVSMRRSKTRHVESMQDKWQEMSPFAVWHLHIRVADVGKKTGTAVRTWPSFLCLVFTANKKRKACYYASHVTCSNLSNKRVIQMSKGLQVTLNNSLLTKSWLVSFQCSPSQFCQLLGEGCFWEIFQVIIVLQFVGINKHGDLLKHLNSRIQYWHTLSADVMSPGKQSLHGHVWKK